MKACLVLGISYAVIALAALYAFGDQITLLFVDRGEVELLRNTRMFLLVNGALFIPLVFVNVMRFLIQGMGFSKFAILAGVCEMFARSFVGFVLVPLFGYIAVCYASPVAWIAADLFLIPAYGYVMRQLRRMFAGRNAGAA